MNVLITGGAGFIGSRLALRLASEGHRITVLDNLNPQVHGGDATFSANLLENVKCVRADIRSVDILSRELRDTEILVHLAAETGTGQSMYEIERYSESNIQGTAVLLDLVVNTRPAKLRKMIVASSRAIYGEGKYGCTNHGIIYPAARSAISMSAGNFEPTCPKCDSSLSVLPTAEDAPFAPSSFYGLTKQVQEQMILMFAAALSIDAIALRYQNVYGPGQSLQNSYTGILAVFSNLVRQGKDLNVFEDGLESRDFVYIDDVIDATASCVVSSLSGSLSLNVGSGVRTSVLDVARAVRIFFRSDVNINVSGAFRVGDIRHSAADISRICELTSFQPKWTFADGLALFLAWAQEQDDSDAGFENSLVELKRRGLLGKRTPS